MNTITYTVEWSGAEQILTRHLTTLDGCCRSTRSLHRNTLWRFLTELSQPDEQGTLQLILAEDRILRWMIQHVASIGPDCARRRVSILGQYTQKLAEAGLVGADLMALFRAHHGERPWHVIARALQAEDSETALAAVYPDPSPPGPLAIHMRTYFALHRSLGKQYRQHELVLKRFDRFLQSQGVCSPQSISRALVGHWLDTLNCCPKTRVWYAGFTDRFFQYLQQTQVVANNPVTTVLIGMPRVPRRSFRPFIFTHEQITAILAKARQLPGYWQFPLRGPTCHTMLILLYVLGLRHGEALHLRVRDLDWERQTLFINETKFHKSRYVPFGPKVANCLRQFLESRLAILPPLHEDDPLFIAFRRKPFWHNVLQNVFRSLLHDLSITGIEGQRGPRLHDLRHTFAVHRLLRWYREGVNVQGRLSVLSTFMGHVEPVHTQVYLTITSELLQEANTRFHRHFGCLFDQEVRP